MFTIQGYETVCNCDHCGRSLKHGIKLSDGRIVGAMCLDKQITKPLERNGKKYRLGSDYIIKSAKVIERVSPQYWSTYGVNQIQFTAI